MDRLPDNEAGQVVRKAIAFVGGWEAWQNKKSFSFYKNITQVDSNEQEIKTQRQLHQYQIHPQFKARMSWEDNGNQYLIINNGQEAKKYKNGEELTDEASKNNAWNASFGSNYVISMPFKLTDPGVILSYEGMDTLANQTVVHSLKVDYEKGAGSAGGMHSWRYYFDLETYDLVANYLDYGNGHSFTTYETFAVVNGIRLHKNRLSYSSNSEQELVRLKTIYTNEEMRFDQTLSDQLFELQ